MKTNKFKTKDTEYGEGYGNGYEKAIQEVKGKVIKLKQEYANTPIEKKRNGFFWLNRVEKEL